MAYPNYHAAHAPAPYQHPPHPSSGGGGYYQPPPPPHPAPPQLDPFRSYYADRLRQLTFNSRPLIQELSIMAMQQRDRSDWNAMGAVVEEIEAAVLRAPPPGKLPLLYLLDSISKNAGAPYTTHLLPPIIPRLYAKTYREVDGHTKSRMDEVIKLWGHTGPNDSPLYGPGVKESVESQIYGATGGPISRQQVLDLLNTTLAAKRREVAYNPAAQSQLAILSQIGDVVNTQNVSSQELAQIMDQLKSMVAAPVPPPPIPPIPMGRPGPPQQQQQHLSVTDHYPPQPHNRPPFPPNSNPSASPLPPFPPNMGRETHRGTPPQNYPPSLSTPPYPPRSVTPQPPAHPQPQAAPAAAPLPFDVAKLLQTINAGSLSQARTPEPKSALEAYEDMIINMDVKLTIADMNVPRDLPNAQLPERCRTCGIRMPEGEEKMKAHMDWHFRRNRKDREGQGRGAHRKWLPKAEEWMNEAPQAGPSKTNGREGTPTTGGPKLTQAKLQQLRKRWVRVPQDPIKKAQACPVCKEAFKPEWDEKEEEWVYRNAIDINGTIYHATCRAERLSLTKLMKEDNRKSKSASPKLTPGPDGNAVATSNVKVEKRKQEDDEGGEEDLAKRARIDGAVAAAIAAEMQSQAEAEHMAEGAATSTGDTEAAQSVSNATADPIVEMGSEEAMVQEQDVAALANLAEQKHEDVVMVQPVEEVVVKQE